MVNLTLIGMIGGLIGGPLMYLLNHKSLGGREIVGGVILGVVSVLGYLWITKRSILRYMDAAIPALILAMGIGRIGCLMFGCCWGGTCETASGERSLAWAIRFPYFSPLYIKDWQKPLSDVPKELIWINPESKEKEPIPPQILAIDDIDSDKSLMDWGAAAYAFNQARKGDPRKSDLDAVSKAYADATKVLKDKNALRLAAAAHLTKLNATSETGATTWHDLRELAKSEHTAWVHPAQLYDFIALVLLFFVLSAIFWRRYRCGTVLAWAMILYPINRVTLEIIRTDNAREFGGLTISQLICSIIFVVGVVFTVWLAYSKPASPTTVTHAHST